MGSGYSIIKRLAEDAIEALINDTKGTDLAGVTLYKGIRMEELVLDRIEIIAEKSEPEIIGDFMPGNWWVDMAIATLSHADDVTAAVHQTRSDVVGELMLRTDIPDQINSLMNNFYVYPGYAGWMPGASEDEVIGHEYITTFNVRIYCAPQDEPS